MRRPCFFALNRAGLGHWRRIVTLSDVSAEGRFKNMAGLLSIKYWPCLEQNLGRLVVEGHH